MKLPFFKKNEQHETCKEEKYDKERVEEIFFGVLNKKRATDPLIGAKLGGKDVFSNLLKMMKDSRGVHTESLLCALGSLAGYSCQASLRREFIEANGIAENKVFVIIEGADNRKYLYGDLINKPLGEDHYSIWGLAGGASKKIGLNELIDVLEIVEYVAGTIGTEKFGVPRMPAGHELGDTPYNYVRHLWPVFLPVIERYCASPREWPIMMGLAVQEGIILCKDAIEPSLALSIVMESAIPMAKLDIPELHP